MARSQKPKSTPEAEALPLPSTGPLVFISHDARDAELAEAFSKLLKSVSAGMIKTFRSSDKKGTEGIDFGDEWYKRLMTELQSTSDVVCLFTEHSLDRPWILFEAGVAKGKLNTPVVGVALGVPLSRVSAGPFYQFQNMDDSEADLAKLVHQLSRRIPGLELDSDVVKVQVGAFKLVEAEVLKKGSASGGKKETKEEAGEAPIAKLAEEMKALPSRVAERLLEVEEPYRRRRMRRFNPMMFEEIMHMPGASDDPIGILMAASLIRDDAPWLYEIAMEMYRLLKSGDGPRLNREIERIDRLLEFTMRGPFMEFAPYGKETHMFMMEFAHMLQHLMRRILKRKKTGRHRINSESEAEQTGSSSSSQREGT